MFEMAISTSGAIAGVMSCLCTQNYLYESLAKQFRHLRRPKKNLNKLKSLMEELVARREDVSSQLEQMWLQKGMKPKIAVELWLKNTEKLTSEVSGLIRNIEQGNTSADSFSPRYFFSRIKLGENIEKKISEVVQIIEKGQFSDDSMVETSPKKGYTLPTARLMQHGTTMESLILIWELLLNDWVKKIGVYGMGGVGKTTIMSEINNRLLKENRHFDCVIWVSVSKEISLEKLQKAIGEKLDVDLSKFQDETTRAAALFEALERRGRFVLILDDLWEPFSFERVGIPILTSENGCKVVITTRKLSVCRGMETDQDVEVRVLTDSEAWDLFRDKVGDKVLALPEIRQIAKDMTLECMGLPLGIITVGRALRNATDVSEWEIALLELRASSINIEQMEEAVFSRLKFSFTKLKDDTMRSCFLFCALYPEGHLIDANELIEYWMWEGLLGRVGRTSASKQKGKLILNELRYACLLESVPENGMECVKMHDLIRDMAITIMTADTRWRSIVKAGIGMTKTPHIDEWEEDVQRVSLMRNDLKNVFVGNPPSCPRVTSLLLQYNYFAENMPYDFFDFTQGLMILDLSYTGITLLPGSVSNLENLRALLLSNCWNLRTLPSLAKLIKLMALDLSCSRNIRGLPHGMEHLCNLRRLNISNTMIQALPSGLLSTLTLLEELLACNALDFQVPLPSTNDTVRIEEVISASSLSSLELDFWSSELFDMYTKSGHWVQLDKFRFNVGPGDLQFGVLEQRSIAFLGVSVTPESPIIIPANTIELKFCDCHDITQLTSCLLNAEKLKKCTVVCCYSVESIVDPAHNDLSMLETMVLRYLINLQMICRELVTASTLTSLRIITVEYCPNLKYLFSGHLLLQLLNLEEIRVRHCSSMENLTRWEAGGNIYAAKILLPKLHKLRLEFMPKLKEIYKGFISFGSLHSVEVISCDALKRLPFYLDDAVGIHQQLLATPALEIKGTKYWWDSLEWDEVSVRQSMQSYFVELPMVSDHVGSSSQVGADDA
ncbi:hypothetical protein L6164_036583 [Bauhinia variegata]|uniref:Uncharacterized protein n=1 Tax=Bauhinia variegata TaxID=167791 RepID=A0ACB9KHF8_BAUVA|nr:hypothetical protein L6164_036583 [Bauhinia variegata]